MMKYFGLLMAFGFFILNSCTSSTGLTQDITIEISSTVLPFTPTTTVTVTPNPSETPTPNIEPLVDGWNTFYNPEFGFSFQYPALFDEGFQSLESTCNISVEENTPNKLFVVIGDILLYVEKTNLNLAEYTNYFIENHRQGWSVKQNQINVHGFPATRLEYHLESPPRYGVVTILVKDNSALALEHFEINFFHCDLEEDNHSSFWIYERILQSLKFEQ